MLLRRWAPYAHQLALVADGHVLHGEREVGAPGVPWSGWVTFDDERLTHGVDYQLQVDGEPVPDPLSRWLPRGVHGPARVFDPTWHRWTDSAWRGRPLDGDAVMYELHVGTFTPGGTLDHAAERLPDLAELGVSHVELMPLAAFDGRRGWGYDGVALNAVHAPYGGPEALCRFVDQAHALGLAVVLDVVHNHLGPSGNYWHRFGPLFTDRHHTPWGQAVNLDAPGSDQVRELLVDSATGWLRDFHLDGLRLDAVHELRDERARPYPEELTAVVDDLAHELGRPLAVIAESDRNDARTVTSRRDGGQGFTAQWDDDVHHALHWLLTGETTGYYADFGSLSAVRHALEHAFLHDGGYSSFRGRHHGRPVEFAVTPPDRFVVALQTHDQVGNRAAGERLSQLVPVDRAAAGAAILLALPYVPMLFMGEEWGARTPWCFFSAFDDPNLAEAVTAGRRREFSTHGWPGDVPDPQDPDTFERSVVRWDERADEQHQSLWLWHASLIEWRRSLPTRRPPVCAFGEQPDGSARWFSVHVGPRLVVANLSDDDVTVGLAPSQPTTTSSGLDLCWAPSDGDPAGARLTSTGLLLPPASTAALHGYRVQGGLPVTRPGTPAPMGAVSAPR